MASTPHAVATSGGVGPAYNIGGGGTAVTATPVDIDFGMHRANRERVLANLIELGEGTVPKRAVMLFQGGEERTRDDTDHEPLFRQESNFHYLFGVREPGCFGTIDVPSGRSTLFIPRLPAVYATWMGEIKAPAHFKRVYGVDECRFVDELEETLAEADPIVLYTFKGLNTDSGNYAKEATFEGKDKFRVDNGLLFTAVVEARVIKSEAELEVMRYVNAVTCDAHMAVMAHARPGLKEYQLESLFQHWCYYNGGARNMSYTCICGSGKNGATLHYGHAGAPNEKTVSDGDMCLFDMGCEYHCYASDVTCSFPANGRFTDDQRLIHNAVLSAQRAVLDAVKPGVMWKDMHELAYRTALSALLEGGLLQGDLEMMMTANLGATLMPHGLGHFIGIDTHDCGGYPKGTSRDVRDGFRSLRTVRRLAAGMCVTVEPGVYFIDHLLSEAMRDETKAAFFVPDVLRRFWRPAPADGSGEAFSFGGVRLEDCITITADGCENMTVAPRTVEEVEACMAGELTDRRKINGYKAASPVRSWGAGGGDGGSGSGAGAGSA